MTLSYTHGSLTRAPPTGNTSALRPRPQPSPWRPAFCAAWASAAAVAAHVRAVSRDGGASRAAAAVAAAAAAAARGSCGRRGAGRGGTGPGLPGPPRPPTAFTGLGPRPPSRRVRELRGGLRARGVCLPAAGAQGEVVFGVFVSFFFFVYYFCFG